MLKFLSPRSCPFTYVFLPFFFVFLFFCSFHLFQKDNFLLSWNIPCLLLLLCDWLLLLLLRKNYRSCQRCMWQIWHPVTPTRLPVFRGEGFGENSMNQPSLFVSIKLEEFQAVTILCPKHVIQIHWQENVVWVCIRELWGHTSGSQLVKFKWSIFLKKDFYFYF